MTIYKWIFPLKMVISHSFLYVYQRVLTNSWLVGVLIDSCGLRPIHLDDLRYPVNFTS